MNIIEHMFVNCNNKIYCVYVEDWQRVIKIDYIINLGDQVVSHTLYRLIEILVSGSLLIKMSTSDLITSRSHEQNSSPARPED